nr:hypothetical protein [uncultured Psychroserpens sp.]
MRNHNLLYIIFLFIFVSCNSDDDKIMFACGDNIIVNENLFSQESPNDFSIQNAQISEDCIFITIVSNGCDMETWVADLVTDGLETTSIPPGRLLSLKFTNLEDCEAAFIKTYQFYLGNETQTVIYALEGWDGELVHNP